MSNTRENTTIPAAVTPEEAINDVNTSTTGADSYISGAAPMITKAIAYLVLDANPGQIQDVHADGPRHRHGAEEDVSRGADVRDVVFPTGRASRGRLDVRRATGS